MTSLADAIAEDRRLIMLRALLEANGMKLNETILKMAVNRFGATSGRDTVRAEMAWLQDQGLVRVEWLPTADGDFWVAHLTIGGIEVAEGRTVPGVARRTA